MDGFTHESLHLDCIHAGVVAAQLKGVVDHPVRLTASSKATTSTRATVRYDSHSVDPTHLGHHGAREDLDGQVGESSGDVGQQPAAVAAANLFEAAENE